MRIAFHTPRASHLTAGFSGDKTLVRDLLSGLEARGHEVRIVSRLNVRDVWRGRVPVARLAIEALSVRRAMRSFSPDAWLVYDVSVTNPDLLGWWQRPKRYVLMNATTGTGKRLPRRWRWLFASAHRRSLARADAVAAYHVEGANSLRPWVRSASLFLMLPAVKTWDAVPSRHDARERLDLPQDATVVLCASRFSVSDDPRRPEKTDMILNLLAAAKSLPASVVVVIAGDGPGFARVQEEAAKLEPERRVQLVGSVEHEHMRWFYAACDLFAYPHIVDAPWLAILEAQACGRAVLTMRTRCAELTVDAGRTGLLAGDLKEFADHLAALAGDRPRCLEMGNAALRYIATHHSLDARIAQLEDLLTGHERPAAVDLDAHEVRR